jgi:UTP--glucose-1-phosphate uridylyltransferase
MAPNVHPMTFLFDVPAIRTRLQPVAMDLQKIVIPAAGLGTRFLPATKAVPKEMLPIVDVPTLQLIVEEAVAAGARDVIVVNGRFKSAIEEHFDVSFELETTLKERNKTVELDILNRVSTLANIISVRQKRPLGLGHAVLCAEGAVGNQAFGVMLGDDIVDSEVPAILQLWRAYLKHKKGVVALMEVPLEHTSMYGVAAGSALDERSISISQLVEKPKTNPPSNLAVIGRYILPPSIFSILKHTEKGVGGEIQLTDALAQLARTEGLIGYRFEGTRHDAGDKLGYLKANIAYAMKRPELRIGLVEYMKTQITSATPTR